MIDITVIRDPGDVPGEDIVDTLILTEQVAIERGRNEIDKNAAITPTRIECLYRSGLDTGQVVQVLDSLQGAAWVGKIVGLDISVEGPATTANLALERV